MPRSKFLALAACGLAFGLSMGCSQDRPAAEAPATATEQAAVEPPSLDVPPADEDSSLALNVPTEPPARSARLIQPVAPLPASEAPLPLDHVPVSELLPPNVVLSEQHAALCKVRVGDPFPALELSPLDGQPHSLPSFYGQRLTIVTFWNSRHPNGLEELSDMQRYFLPRFGEQGLAVLSIHTGENPDVAIPLVAEAGATYPIFSDPDGAALSQVSAGMLPRTFLLDPAGKILWLDLEYSATTRRDLATLIRILLRE
jgi:peroxiredoxin